MRRSWLTFLAIGGLIVLLAAIGVFQYRWLTQISETEGEKAKVRVKEQADRFAADFNREIQGAYFNFQTEAEDWKAGNWTSFNERYDFWRTSTGYPGLIRSLEFLPVDRGLPALRYDPLGRNFVTTADDERIGALRARLTDEKPFKPIDLTAFTLVAPIHEAPPKILGLASDQPTVRKIQPANKYGYVVVSLDEDTLRRGLIGDLSRKYFGEGDYRVSITDPAGGVILGAAELSGQPDATARLFDLSPDDLFLFTNRELLRKVGGERKERTTVINSHVEGDKAIRMPAAGQQASTVKIELKGDGGPRTSVFTATMAGEPAEPVTLAVQHTAGSIQAFTTATLQRNLLFGFGLLSLLTLAIFAIIVSSMRARKLAQRQIDFVSSVSHEFRTPLAVIYSAGENLADGVAIEREQVSRYGELIKGEGRKLSSMVEQILEFAGASSGKRRYKFAPATLATVVDDALAECRPTLEEKGFTVEASVSPELPQLNVDAEALSMAVQNLINNSIKYSNGSRWLGISAASGGGTVRLSVEDRGIGISDGEAGRIFQPFYRSKAVVDAQIHGNGLGLSLVKEIVSAHGGKVSVKSTRGSGSTFTIELPARQLSNPK